MSIVLFDPEEFRSMFPETAATLADAQLAFAFDAACLVVSNTERSRVPYNPPGETARKTVLYLLARHVCELELRGGGIVGTMTDASEGSVSARFSKTDGAGADWFDQTQWGATAWRMLRPYTLGGQLHVGCFR